MGYDLHITRAEHWAQNRGREITLEEWFTLVAGDPELTLDRVNGEELALWSRECEHPHPWFQWRRGNISTKYPDRAMILKMIEIAGRFGARVQGDEGEEYKGLLGGKLALRFKSVIVGKITDAYWTDRVGHGIFQPSRVNPDDPAIRRFREYVAFLKGTAR